MNVPNPNHLDVARGGGGVRRGWGVPRGRSVLRSGGVPCSRGVMFGNAWGRLVRLSGGLLLAWVLGITPGSAEVPQETATAILAGLPSGTPAERGWWLYERALRERDGNLALELMRVADERFGGAPGERASLWIVRFFAAAGDWAAARAALPARIGSDAPADLFAEWRYWRVLLEDQGNDGGESVGVAGAEQIAALQPDGGGSGSGTDGDPVAWSVMTSVASIGNPVVDNDHARAVLGIEGAVRRHGLLAPYAYRLLHAGHGWLTSAGRTLSEASGAALVHAPGAALLDGLLRELPVRSPLGEEPGEPREPQRPTGFSVQVGAFLQESSAQNLVRELGSHGFRAYVSPTDAGEGPPLQRVRLGPCSDLATAESLGTRLARSLMLPYQIVEEDERAGPPGSGPETNGAPAGRR